MFSPGSRLLAQAARLICFQKAEWREFGNMTETPDGQLVPDYRKARTVKGSWQPISASTKNAMGLDISQEYANFYTQAPIKQPSDNQSADILIYNGSNWLVLTAIDWVGEDGWRAVMVVRSDVPVRDSQPCPGEEMPNKVEVILDGA